MSKNSPFSLLSRCNENVKVTTTPLALTKSWWINVCYVNECIWLVCLISTLYSTCCTKRPNRYSTFRNKSLTKRFFVGVLFKCLVYLLAPSNWCKFRIPPPLPPSIVTNFSPSLPLHQELFAPGFVKSAISVWKFYSFCQLQLGSDHTASPSHHWN